MADVIRAYRTKIGSLKGLVYDTETNPPFTLPPESELELNFSALGARVKFLIDELEDVRQLYLQLPRNKQDGTLERLSARVIEQIHRLPKTIAEGHMLISRAGN